MEKRFKQLQIILMKLDIKIKKLKVEKETPPSRTITMDTSIA